MNGRLDIPIDWTGTAALTHRDLMTLMKMLIRPVALRYILFGFGKPRSHTKGLHTGRSDIEG